MSQVNINSDMPSSYSDTSGAKTAAASNLTWAIALVLIIAAIAVALVFLSHNIHI